MFRRLISQRRTNIGATGNAVNNRIEGSSTGNALYGVDGNDTLLGMDGNDTLDGGAGVDRLAGGLGDDTYYVDSRSDVIVELANEGTDTVYASASYTLPSQVEILILQEGGDYSAGGNSLNNRLEGNSGNNVLAGGLGKDTLVGGLGNDIYVLSDNLDTLVDAGGIDTIRLGLTESSDLTEEISTLDIRYDGWRSATSGLSSGSSFCSATSGSLCVPVTSRTEKVSRAAPRSSS